MSQGKLEVVKQEMARLNVDILGISKLKWTGIGEFKSDDHCIYYCGQESLRGNGAAIIFTELRGKAVDVTGDEARSDAVNSNIAQEPGMLGP